MPRSTTPGFSTLNQLKRRNTLKDGIILIQTLLIILFIIVPIFLLLDKVPTGAEGGVSSRRLGGWHRADRTWAGPPCSQTLWLLIQPQVLSIGSLFIHSFSLGDSFLLSHTQTHIPGPSGDRDRGP